MIGSPGTGLWESMCAGLSDGLFEAPGSGPELLEFLDGSGPIEFLDGSGPIEVLNQEDA